MTNNDFFIYSIIYIEYTMTKTKKNYKTNKGGRVLASGGFGCVFEPALKCEGKQNRETGKISKLMINKYAKQEYDEINSIKQKLDDIPNYQDFFLLEGATLCRPQEITESDLVDFDKKCSALKKNNITKKNIDSKLKDIMSLNLPNGGIPIDDYIYTNGSFEKLYELHVSLVLLLKKGIIPMNKKHTYHNDIKDSNVLVEKTKTTNDTIKSRLIDWGLSTQYIPFKGKPLPSTWKNRPFQFNVPFSVIIFSDEFAERFDRFMQYTKNPSLDDLKAFTQSYIAYWNSKRGSGHYKFINEIFYTLYEKKIQDIPNAKKPKVIETHYTMPTIVDYITNILVSIAGKNIALNRNKVNISISDSSDSESSESESDSDSNSDSDSDSDSNSSESDSSESESNSTDNSNFVDVPSEKKDSFKFDFLFEESTNSDDFETTKNKKQREIGKKLIYYLDNVFIKNVDIWGFISCYYPFIETLSNNYTSLNPKEKELLNCLKGIYINILYSTSNSPINLPKLFGELKKIEELLSEIKDASSQSSLAITAGTKRKTLKNKQRKNGKTNKITDRKKIFIRKPKIKRFKNPFYLSNKK